MLSPEQYPNDAHLLPFYEMLCLRYGLTDAATVIKLYDAQELLAFLPENPTPAEQETLRALIGAQAASGYLDYARSNNTFELLMQWQEATGHWLDGGLPDSGA